jgi:hypothetical protein
MDGAEGERWDAGAAWVRWYLRQQKVKLQSTYRKGTSLAYGSCAENKEKKTDLACGDGEIGK